MSNTTKIRCNGTRVQQLRVRQSMTQEKLAAMCKVNQRTVQRAERSEHLQLDTLASLADALRVTVGELTLPEGDPDQTDQPETSESNAVVLRRMTSGKALIDLVCGSFSGVLYCEAEPTDQNIDALSDMVERIEKLIPDPWKNTNGGRKPNLGAASTGGARDHDALGRAGQVWGCRFRGNLYGTRSSASLRCR